MIGTCYFCREDNKLYNACDTCKKRLCASCITSIVDPENMYFTEYNVRYWLTCPDCRSVCRNSLNLGKLGHGLLKQYSDNQKLMNKSHERRMVELEKENVILCRKVYSMRLFIGNIKVHFAKFVNLIQESTTTIEVIRVAIKELMNIINIPLSNMESS